MFHRLNSITGVRLYQSEEGDDEASFPVALCAHRNTHKPQTVFFIILMDRFSAEVKMCSAVSAHRHQTRRHWFLSDQTASCCRVVVGSSETEAETEQRSSGFSRF